MPNHPWAVWVLLLFFNFFFFLSGRQLEKEKLIETELPETGGTGQLVEYLPSMHEALVSIHSTTAAQHSPGDSCLEP